MVETREHHRAAGAEGASGHRHPTPRDYVRIAVVLAILTALEVSIFYIDLGPAEVPTLIILMVLKFLLVALWFMHLRFDAPFLSRVFYGGMVLAISLYVVVWLTFLESA